MKEINEFWADVSESIERVRFGAPPRIELYGWWWKRYIPYYRRLQTAMQQLLEMQWKQNKDQIADIMDRLERESFKNYK